ncbi:hypothetical protein ACFB49_42780 [Sphingomonas sp. DBB INV C78]|uniref:DUF2303 family protein n=1 Tax=Sphingomonas sp. DBB INV C78 TaxID=3349434 RepID=UPI0036D380D4
MDDIKTDAALIEGLAAPLLSPAAGTGEALKEIRKLVDEHFRPTIDFVTDPSTGTVAPVVVSNDSVAALPSNTFEGYLAQPRDRRGTANLTSLDSLIAHVNRFHDDDSVIFASDDRSSPSLTAVLDYHRAGAAADPRFGRHRSHFAFPLSDEWKAWVAQNAKPMKMAEFAAFLEDRIIDVLYLIPDEDEVSEDLQKYINALGGNALIATPQKLVELSRGLQVYESSAVREAVKLESGEGQISFSVEHTDGSGAPLRVPSLFLIGIPVFRNGHPYRIAARLRYRKADGGLLFWYDLWRVDRTFDHAFNEARERVQIETGVPVLLGKPEA